MTAHQGSGRVAGAAPIPPEEVVRDWEAVGEQLARARVLIATINVRRTEEEAEERRAVAEEIDLDQGIGLELRSRIADLCRRFSPSHVHHPPGHRAGECLRILLGARAFDRVFGQTIADAHEEWLEAHVVNDLAEAKRVKFRAVFYLLWAAALYVVARVGALVSDLRKLSGPKS